MVDASGPQEHLLGTDTAIEAGAALLVPSTDEGRKPSGGAAVCQGGRDPQVLGCNATGLAIGAEVVTVVGVVFAGVVFGGVVGGGAVFIPGDSASVVYVARKRLPQERVAIQRPLAFAPLLLPSPQLAQLPACVHVPGLDLEGRLQAPDGLRVLAGLHARLAAPEVRLGHQSRRGRGLQPLAEDLVAMPNGLVGLLPSGVAQG
mmetsp:Transcript_38052/g.104701  ORF Transcript_38052/g.104701 Transcript_38052/m.104701 type:complete len:203 (+) Transcript_38052:171-779(+)